MKAFRNVAVESVTDENICLSQSIEDSRQTLIAVDS